MKLQHIALASLLFYVCDLYAANPIEPIMMTIPKGSFEMGDTSSERPQPVHLTIYLMSKRNNGFN